MTATGPAAPSDREPADDPIGVVRAFLAALEALDVDAALALASPDIVYQNVPLPPARGIDQFGQQLRFLERWCTGFEAQLHSIAADGGTVLTERTDALERGSLRAAFWVCGTFDVEDGRITLWRDRFDWVTVIGAVVAAFPRAALHSLASRT
jgi:limonene-1,2-epoxide hydrolase